MSLKLRCAATGDLLLLSATAAQLLGLLGKRSDEPGILGLAEMDRALHVLRQLSDDTPSGKTETVADGDDPHAEPAFQDEGVSLRKRAWPLIKMIEEAQAAGKPIVWGV